MVLDNRTTLISIFSLPSELANYKAIGAHFAGCGEISGIHLQGNDAVIQFANRRAAERAMIHGRTFKSQPLHMSWRKKISTSQESVSSFDPQEVISGSGDVEEEVEVVEEVYQGYDEKLSEPTYESDEEEKDGERSWKRT